jgi:hypothetical protein
MLPETPEAAVAAVFAALATGALEGVVNLIDPAALEAFKEGQLALATLHDQVGADAFSDMDWPAGTPHPHLSFTEGVFGVSRLEELAKMPPEALLLRWLQTARPLNTQEPQREVLGVVREGVNRAHVVFRETRRPPLQPPDAAWDVLAVTSTVRVITVTRQLQGWATQLNGGLVYDDAGGSGIGFGTSSD